MEAFEDAGLGADFRAGEDAAGRCWRGIKCRMEDRSTGRPATHAAAPLREMKWSPAEKAVARRAFDLALGRELEAVVREAKDRTAKIQEPSELWELEGWLTERRQGIDRKYDYRYSVLPLVLAALLSEGHLTEDELRGLGQDKLQVIRRATRS
jgi:hypothetical protein